VPRHGQRLSSFLEATGNGREAGEAADSRAAGRAALLRGLEAAESEIYVGEEDPLFNWDSDHLVSWCEEAGFRDIETEWYAREERRSISVSDLRRWIIGETAGAEQAKNTRYRAALERHLDEEQLEQLYQLLRERVQAREVTWRTYYLFLTARR
jgi:hypothetical protein